MLKWERASWRPSEYSPLASSLGLCPLNQASIAFCIVKLSISSIIKEETLKLFNCFNIYSRSMICKELSHPEHNLI